MGGPYFYHGVDLHFSLHLSRGNWVFVPNVGNNPTINLMEVSLNTIP